MRSRASEPGGYWDGPQHLVTLTHGFYFGKYEVTQGEHLSLMQTNPSFFIPVNGYSADLARPVEQVSWDDATGYCEQLTQREQADGRLPSDWTYRLPTEAEWEYACRAGATTAFPFGPALYSGRANFDGTEEYDASSGGTDGLGDIGNPLGISLGRTTTVGSYDPSPWGLADLQGNVSEWCQDWYEDYSTAAAIDPQGALTGDTREFRGGSWFDLARGCRAAARYGEHPTTRARFLGFRVTLAQTQQ